jgi:hypothetical protein
MSAASERQSSEQPMAFPKTGSPDIDQRPSRYTLTSNRKAGVFTAVPDEDPLDPTVIARKVSAGYIECGLDYQITTNTNRLEWAAKLGAEMALKAVRELGGQRQ